MQANDELCQALGRMPNLAHLELRQPSYITARGLDRLASLERLRTLRLGPSAAAPGCSYQSISRHTQLTELELCFTGKNRPLTAIPGGVRHMCTCLSATLSLLCVRSKGPSQMLSSAP